MDLQKFNEDIPITRLTSIPLNSNGGRQGDYVWNRPL